MLILKNGNYFTLEIPITTKYSKDDYGINIVGFTADALEPLTCTLSRNDKEIIANFEGNMVYYGWNADFTGDNSSSKPISLGDHTYYIKDIFGNTGSCSISIENTSVSSSVDCGNNLQDSGGCYHYTGANAHYTGSYYCKLNSGTGNLVQYNCSALLGSAPYCPSGYTLSSINCSYDYSCSSGYLVNKSCKIYTSVTIVTTYSCPSGYTKISNRYCYK